MNGKFRQSRFFYRQVVTNQMLDRRLFLLFIMATFIGMNVAFFLTNVDVSLTAEDEKYIRLISAEIQLPYGASYSKSSYLEKIAVITKIGSHFEMATRYTRNLAMPPGMTREPKDWYFNRTGVCYDVARVTEKVLRQYGFDVRHAAVYSTQETGSAILSFAKRRTPSHAVLEVLTERGWVMIDPYSGMVAVTKGGDPIGAADVRYKMAASYSPTSFHTIFSGPYLVVYGLYSRHGMAFPPFNILPDINWVVLVKNGCCVNVK